VIADFDRHHAFGVLCCDGGYCTGSKHSEGMERFEISLDAGTAPRVTSRDCQSDWAILSSFNQKYYLLECQFPAECRGRMNDKGSFEF
tara:strand:- start:255 stop:518 length:264 start_codon:yes stop_codon:yes gene_type:complete